jgi:DNA modification methylase
MTEPVTCAIYHGDCIDVMRTLPSESVHCCVTSPPYWGLRDYVVSGQIGLEPTVEAFVAKMVDVFEEVRRLLRPDGTCWVNLGDSYAQQGGPGFQGKNGQRSDRRFTATRESVGMREIGRTPPIGFKPKDLVGIPWRVAFAMQEAGWWLRQDIIWHKPNPMPESIRDRCTKAHEYLFLLTKSERYYWDFEAMQEPVTGNAHRRVPAGWAVGDQPHNAAGLQKDGVHRKTLPGVTPKSAPEGNGKIKSNASFNAATTDLVTTRNRRSVWTVPSEPCKEAHFATYPPALIRPCILAGCPTGGTVLDPFGGSGTTGQVAIELGRRAVLIELNPEYVKIAEQRTHVTPGLNL